MEKPPHDLTLPEPLKGKAGAATPAKGSIALTTDNTSPETFNHVYARDRAAVVTCAILAILRDALGDPEIRNRIAATLRFEFADLERQVLSENRPNGE